MLCHSLQTIGVLYLTFVRSYIGYASEVWAPSTIGSITKNRESSTQGNKIHLKHALARGYFLSWAPFSPQSATVNILARSHYTVPIADYVKPKGTRLTRHSSDQDVLIPKCRTKLFQFSYFNRIAGIRYLHLLVLLVLLISLNVTYSNAIRLLFVQTMTSLTLTPGSRSAANAVGHVIFY